MRSADVAVLIKAFQLLEVLAQQEWQGLSALSSQTSVAKSSAFRILTTLQHLGYIAKRPTDRTYSAGPRLVALSCAFVAGSSLVQRTRAVLEQLHAEFGETVNLGILNDSSIVYVDIIESSRDLRMAARVGQRDRLHCTALGKAILSCLPNEDADRLVKHADWTPRTANTISDPKRLKQQLGVTRERGFALDEEENEPGACCVAVPIRKQSGWSDEAISISGPSVRMTEAMITRMARRLKAAAREIEVSLGYRGPHSSGEEPVPKRRTRSRPAVAIHR